MADTTTLTSPIGMELPHGYQLVVGLEVHVELNTVTKMWCGCANDFGAEPNTNVCPVCTGQPGALPVVNGDAVIAATRLGLALNCGITERCRFHRKNYFYPDMAKNYQISQYDIPLCHDGWLDVTVEGVEGRVEIERLHMEEDTGKSTHVGESGRIQGATRSLIDYNRCGVPLLEIVSRPDIHDPATAQSYLRELQQIVQAVGVSDARMEEGSMRCDANVSVHKPGTELGTRTEIKNLNSVRSLGRAIAFEARRQVQAIEDGETIHMETRYWDEVSEVTGSLRRKETVTDYRYFPDPDLVEMYSPADKVAELLAALPELPRASRDRLVAEGVDETMAITLVNAQMMKAHGEAVAAGADPATAAIWLTGELTGQLTAASVSFEESRVTGAQIGELVALIADGTLSNNLAKDVVGHLVADRGSRSPAQIAEAEGLQQVSDEGELRAIVEQVVADNAGTVEAIRDGNDKAIGALVGQVMKATKGQADPKTTNQLLREVIG